jgi:predicted RNase H-like HicB family nuclease
MSRVRTKVAAPLKVVFEPDGGAWHVYVPAVQGCRSHGRSLSAARRNIREALALFDREGAELVEDVRLPRSALQALVLAKRAHDALMIVQKTAQDRARASARQLLAVGLSLRDAGELMGLSHEHVKQLAKAQV